MTMDPNVIKVNGVELEGFAARIRNSAGQLDTQLDELRTKLDAIVWTGQDKESYEIQRQQWTIASRDLFALLDRIGNTVHLAKTNYGGTEGTNAKMFMV
ncbi:WXG100 family type VII secretion target [Stackebrandtia soli]|uniref:WXG100 family type VII secretion target n=1 Tax=Stackebrandtia soli TaxID=1892856 RepID=UPI0039ED436D